MGGNERGIRRGDASNFAPDLDERGKRDRSIVPSIAMSRDWKTYLLLSHQSMDADNRDLSANVSPEGLASNARKLVDVGVETGTRPAVVSTNLEGEQECGIQSESLPPLL
jgi:hypothetical protein